MGRELTNYTQDFNSLPAVNDGIWENGTSYMDSWFVQRTKETNTIVASPGNNIAGNLYSFGSDNSIDRALGAQSSYNAGEFAWGVLLQNNTGDTIHTVDVSFYGEQWRISNIDAGEHKIDFYYAVSSDKEAFQLSPRSDKNWIPYPALNFNGPHFYTRGRALNGNNAANRRLMEAVLTVDIPDGHYLMLRWKDDNEYEVDHGLAIDDFSITWSVKPDEPIVVLPVELARFTAKVSGPVVDLQWLTASEMQNDYFSVERSSDGQAFESIGRVAGHGTTAIGAAYKFADNHPLAGISYYRLKQVDEDGSHAYSAVVAVTRAAGLKVAKVYPTITTDKLQVSVEQTGVMHQVLVLDMLGKQWLLEALDNTALHHTIDVSNLRGGSYVLVLLDEQGQRQTTRFIKN
ncbi:T9SS C-terminal target domain-containing protein [Pontibacter diazotrophicus]|uniref:T9SS C-terminal target domain-containing protein n=1 Tax=Pontibacter diazotrophicus TaxID=1400979 RepID=A0A3D8LEP9_9BACT|nr:T9SS type A sorting domain-containing protein [Pontibacter diazotrophicus]RDV15744.1 T9SS C-terminal target domain-containing protein [Pontibacter diazotrophicus]